MISFVAPASSAFFTTNTTFYIDRNPTISKEVRVLQKKVPYAVLDQTRSDGVNPVTETFTFNIVNLTKEDAVALDGYFNELKGSEAVTITFPEGNKNYQFVDWSLNIANSKYMSMSVKAEEVFL